MINSVQGEASGHSHAFLMHNAFSFSLLRGNNNCQMMFPALLLAIHLNLWDNGFSFCPLRGNEHQENSVGNLGMRGNDRGV